MTQMIEVIVEKIASKKPLMPKRAHEKATNALLAEVRMLLSAEGQKASREKHNKLISRLMAEITAAQENLSIKNYKMGRPQIRKIHRIIKTLDQRLLFDPLAKGVKCPLSMPTLDSLVWPTIKQAIEETDTAEAWQLYHDSSQAMYDWRIKAEKNRIDNLFKVISILEVKKMI